MTSLRIQHEMVKAMSATESLMVVAGQIFGKGETQPAGAITTADDAMAFMRSFNALG